MDNGVGGCVSTAARSQERVPQQRCDSTFLARLLLAGGMMAAATTSPAQGLRSNVSAVSLIAIKPPSDEGTWKVRDVLVPSPFLPVTDAVDEVRLPSATGRATDVYMRNAAGRLVLLGPTWSALSGGRPAALRIVSRNADSTPGSPLRLEFRRTTATGEHRQLHDVAVMETRQNP
jgi:hypothetical protein